MTDVGSYPFRQARNYHQGRLRPIRLIVVHDMESPETVHTAEDVAAWFAGTTAPQASAHLMADSDSIVRTVHDADTAWAAPNANADGLHIEHAGQARQTREQWLDAFGMAMLALTAKAAADWCRAYGIPPVHLTPQQVAAGAKGLCGHWDVTLAYPGTGDHTDPGPNFPWDVWVPLVAASGQQPHVITPAPSVQEDDMAKLITEDNHAIWAWNGVSAPWHVPSPAVLKAGVDLGLYGDGKVHPVPAGTILALHGVA